MPHRFLPLVLVLACLPLSVQAGGLDLRRVMLSTAGVGYFEYEAAVDGPATLALDVTLAQVDDVLASLVVFDSAGSVGAAELPGQDGSRAAFAGVPFGPGALASPLDFLNALQGQRVTVTGPRTMTGQVLRAETVQEPARAPGEPQRGVARTRVSLLTEAGLQQFVLEDADGVQVADPALRAAIARVLEAARAESQDTTRRITLHGGGTGARTLRVGYVAAAPLWKTTYRLVLPEHDGAPARLQGWAVLENDSASDWKGIDLTVQYGNPVTFRQALYRAYYVTRPEVPVEVLGRILPGVDTGEQPIAAAAAAPRAMQKSRREAGMAALSEAPAALAAPQSDAAASEGAEATLFHLATPLTLPAGHTATVPILDRTVPAERIGVVRPGSTHPVQALQIRNDSGSSLPAGMLTLYDTSDAAAFAGDARLGGLPVGETRLLQFAEDLRTRVDWRTDYSVLLLGVTASQGTLRVQRRGRETSRITLTAPASEPRRLLLEIPRPGDATLTLEGDLTPSGATADAWRVPVALAPGESRTVVAYVDRIMSQATALLQDDQVLAMVLNDQALSEAARAALRHIADLRAKLADHESERDRARAQIAAVEQDEDRLRKNLAAVAPGDALRSRLTRSLEADEDQIARLSDAASKADAAATEARDALAQAVQGLQL